MPERQTVAALLGDPDDETHLAFADAILASDWLAGVKADARREGHEAAHAETGHWHSDRPDDSGYWAYAPNDPLPRATSASSVLPKEEK